MASRKPLGKRILKNLGKKWFQVAVTVIVFGAAVALSYRILAKEGTSAADKKKQEAKFKFMHCDKCLKEMTYNKDLAGRPAMACKCKQGDAGYWEPTEKSVADGNYPLRWFYTALLVESLVWLISLYILLARKDAAPEFYFYKCIHCQDMLRYTAKGFDALVVCPSCALYIRLPDEEEAETQDDHNDNHTEVVMAHLAAKLKETGYQFPEDRLAAEEAGEQQPPSDSGTPR